MKIDKFSETVCSQLDKLGGTVTYEIEPSERGYMLRIHLNNVYAVSRYYSEPNISTISEQLVRVQVTHLYNQLAQAVLDTTLGEGQIYVVR